MKNPFLRPGGLLVIMAVLFFTIISVWLIRQPVVWQRRLPDDSILHQMEISPGTLSASSRFVVEEPLPSFFIAAKPHAPTEGLQVVIYQGEEIFFNEMISSDLHVACCDDIVPGIYYLAMSQVEESNGGGVVIARQKLPMLSGWDVWLLVMFVVVAVLVFRFFMSFIKRKAKPQTLASSTF